MCITKGVVPRFRAPEEDTSRTLLGVGTSRRFLVFLLLGDGRSVLVRHLALHSDKVGDVAVGIAERGNEELIPKGSAVYAVIEQANRHVVALFDGLADAFDCLGVGLGALEEAAIAAQNLVERVTRKVEETLRRIHDGIVGEGRVGNDEVLLRRLEGLDEGKVGVVQHLVGDALRRRDETIHVAAALGLEQLVGLVVAQVAPDRVAELLVLFLQECHRLLEGFQQELFADAGALGVLAVALTELGEGTKEGQQFGLEMGFCPKEYKTTQFSANPVRCRE